MAKIDEAIWKLSGVLSKTFGAATAPQRVNATVARVDKDGTGWLEVEGNPDLVPMELGAGYDKGDVLSLDVSGPEPRVSENVTALPATMRAVNNVVEPVKRVAADARKIAEATGQHFWYDDNGAHVSTEQGNPTGAQNALWNSLGMLFRSGANILLAIVAGNDSGVDVYDGEGNEDENTVASLRGSRVRVGYEDGAHVAISSDGIEGTNSDGMTVLDVASEADTGSTLVEKRIGEVVTWSADQTATESATADIIERYAVATGGGIVVTLKCAWTITTDGATMDVTQRYTFTDGIAASESVLAAGNDIGMTLAYDGGTTVTLTSVPHTSANVTAGEVTLATVAYEADNVPMPAFTLGTRSGDAQGFSYALGDGIETAREHQTVFGQYNNPSATDLLQIGNGTLSNRHNAFSIDMDGNVTATGRVWGAQNCKRLWSGGFYMSADHTATLSEHVRDQPHGIVLVWSGYASSAPQDYDWNFTYIPKGWVANHNGGGLTCLMARAGLAGIGAKYVHVNEGIMGSTTITGDSRNVSSGTACGINYNNALFVLREVWGV